MENNSLKSSPNILIDTINKKITVSNNQTPIAKKAKTTAIFFFIIILMTFQKWSPIAGNWPLMAFSVFFLIIALSVAFVFRSREEKLQALISGDKLLASWTLSKDQKTAYSNYLFQKEKNKNSLILFSISFIAIIVFGIFIIVIDEGKLFMFLVLVGLLIFLSLFAFGAPLYYRYKNLKNDGEILIGAKYAYINGYFHNWDYLLSGLKKIKIIDSPFYGINLVYYYTDRALFHSEELYIPANEEIDLEKLKTELINKNKKQKKNTK